MDQVKFVPFTLNNTTKSTSCNGGKSADLEILQDTRLMYIKIPLTGFFNTKCLRNKITDVRKILHNLSPGYLVLSEINLTTAYR